MRLLLIHVSQPSLRKKQEKQLKLEESLNFPVRGSTQLIYMPVLFSSLTIASMYRITYIHRKNKNCLHLRRQKWCCPGSSADDVILCVDLMLQRLCIHVIKDLILKHLQELPGCFSFFVSFGLVFFWAFGFISFLFLWLYSCISQKEKTGRKKSVKWWNIKENVQMRKDKYQQRQRRNRFHMRKWKIK